MKRLTAIIILLATMIPISRSSALTTAELQNQIAGLLRQIEELSGRLETVKPLSRANFKNDLRFGLRGNAEVKELQGFLEEKGFLLPGFATGNFYSITLKALKDYQSASELPVTGFFGPLTRAKVNGELAAVAAAKNGGGAETIPAAPLGGGSSAVPPASSAPSYATPPRPDYDLKEMALRVHASVNQERAAAGLAPLFWDDQLSELATRHSRDQAADNAETTDSGKLCNYPIIRHEGFVFGFTLKERFENSNVDYRAGGENIAMVPLAENLVYKYRTGEAPADCPQVVKFSPGEGTREERTALYRAALSQSLAAIRGADRVEWANKEWRTIAETSERAVIGWMNSPGHRKNILNAEFTAGGIGIAVVNDYVIITQNFKGN
ncbi:MAG: peptidoglycan-binding protein [Parcubacteria group bacterium]|nr:peptidoglycan-binding protein [Parcubacteria group bacterium]